ncbi:(2Fe-2S)-binding protein [Acidocella sp.]|uniref:(2Fe-2S)-binding protein n=1 Tax=Acidocella sp. TaxID=50710 RepID=UPI003D034569
MYLCICNALTDRRLKDAIIEGRTAKPADVYEACGCRAKCGECVKMVKAMIQELAPDPAAETG